MESMNIKLSLICIFIATLAIVAMVTIEEDEKDCADPLTNLAACIPFVSGNAKIPTPECSEDTKKIRSANPKCLCVLIKESTDPSIGLLINTTLALQMPSACKIDAKVSDCRSTEDSSTGSSTTNSPPASASTSSASSASSTSPASSSSSSGSDTKGTTSSSNNGAAKLCPSFLVIMGSTAIALLL